MTGEVLSVQNKDQHTLSEALASFTPISNSFLKWALEVLPLILLAFILIDTMVTQGYLVSDVMLLTGLLAAAASSYLLYAQLQGISDTLRTLWNRGAIVSCRNQPALTAEKGLFSMLLDKTLPARRRSKDRGPTPDQTLDDHFRDYVVEFQSWLNHRFSWSLGFLFAFIIALSFPYRWGLGFTFTWIPELFRGIHWLDSLGIISQILVAYLIGLLAWRMIVIARKVSQLGLIFNLDVKVQHPDKSGGLRPLGDLCFINALIITVPGIFLAGWILAIPRLNLPFYMEWIGFFRQLLLLVFILAVLAFFQPLYSIHKAMIRQRSIIQQQLDELSKQIDGLSKKLLEEADELGAEKGEEISREITLLRQVYESNSAVPVWPFDKSLILKFITTQAVPILSLTNVGPMILNLVDSLVKFLQQ